MSFLNEQQLLFIRSRLEESGLQNQEVKEELFDHICSSVETKMQQGTHFSSAVTETFQLFGANEFQDIENNANRLAKYKWINRYTISLALVLLMFISGFHYWWNNQANYVPSILPVASLSNLNTSPSQELTPIYKIVKNQHGIDLKVPFQSKVVATAAGEVLLIENTTSGDKKIVLYHNEAFKTVYANLSEVFIEEGQAIKKGQVIGSSGNSLYDGFPNLYYEIICNNKQVNPLDFFEAKKSFSP